MQPKPHTPDMKNLIAAVVLSTAILMGWQFFVEEPKRQEALERAKAMQETSADTELPDMAQAAERVMTKAAPTRQERIAEHKRVRINTDSVHGSINLTGFRIDDVTLADYKETMDADSPEVVLLSPAGGKNTYFAEFGWLPGRQGVQTPNADTVWQTSQTSLSVDKPMTATWNNRAGLAFEQRMAAKGEFLFEIEQRVTNNSRETVVLYPYGLISRTYADEKQKFFILHEGPLGVMNQELNEVSYEDLRDDGKQGFKQVDGWMGITDKYWLTALIPSQSAKFNVNMSHFNREDKDKYQTDYLGAAVTVAPGETASVSSHFFAGAKKVALLDRYGEMLGVPLFDRAVDFGMLYFLTKPIFHALTYFYHLLENFGLAIMLLTVAIKALLFPLANKSYRSMSQLKILMPKINEIRERYADDKLKMNQEIMEFYKREKVNPASGCLPMLVQIPIFFALYKVLFVTIEMRQAPFYGWIKDLSIADPTNVFSLFGLVPWDPPGIMHIGVLPLVMCATMILQQKLNPKPTDPMQAKVMAWLPFIFLFLFASFPAGLVLYWAWNNSLSIIQQWVITRKLHGRHHHQPA